MSSNWRLFDQIQSHAARTPSKIAYMDVETGDSLTYHQLVEDIRSSEIPNSYRIVVQADRPIDLPRRVISGLLAQRAVYLSAFESNPKEVQSALQATASISPILQSCGEILLSSSGTTGLPKIVRRSRQSLDIISQTIAEALSLSMDDKIIAAIPLTHSYGFEHCLLAPLWSGCTMLLCNGLNTSHIDRAIKAGATVFPAVPSMIELLGKLSSGRDDKHRLRLVYSAGAILPVEVAEQFETRWGMQVGQIYGLTEVGSVVYQTPGKCVYGLVGKPFPGVSIQVVSTDDEQNQLPSCVEGQIAIRSDWMMTGYVAEEMPCADGHFLTGDLGMIDKQGQLLLTGRLKLLIDVGGAKVNPLEVESVLNQHPGVAVSVVLPLRLSDTIQKVRAVVVPADPDSPPDAESLRRFIRERLSAYKVPRIIDIQESVPRSPTGKILRRAMEMA